jgi:hypothetical protein
MTPGNGGSPGQPAVRLRNHSRGTLHPRFHHERGIWASLPRRLGERRFHRIHALPVALPPRPRIGPLRPRAVVRTAIAIGGHHRIGAEQQTAIRGVEQVNVPKRHRPDRIPMIGAPEGKESWTPIAPGPAGELPRQLQRDLDRGRPVIREEHLPEARPVQPPPRGRLHQIPGENRRRFIGQTQGGAVGDAPQLATHRRVQPRVRMAMQVGPDRGVGVQVLATLGIPQHRTPS